MSGMREFDGFADLAQGARAVLTRVGLSVQPDGLLLGFPDGTDAQWLWRDLRGLRDQAHRDGVVVYQAGDALTRLVVNDVALAKAIKSNAPSLSRRDRNTPWTKLAGWATAAVGSVALIIFVLVPLMASQLATILPPEGEKALGDTTLEQIRVALDETGLGDGVRTCDAPDGLAALNTMYARLSPEADLPYPVEMHVFDHELVNAFALPGGHVVLFRGLIDQADSADEVAAVLAHEIGHVVYRDPTRDALRSAGSLGVLGLLFGDFAGGTITLFLANSLINASYSQAAEARADVHAHKLLDAANVTPAALGVFFERLTQEHGDMSGIAAHLSSHPQNIQRIKASADAVEDGRNYAPVLSLSEWRDLRQICGARPEPDDGFGGENTRSGSEDSSERDRRLRQQDSKKK